MRHLFVKVLTLLVLALSLLAGSQSARASTTLIQWSCPQSSPSAIPSSQTLTLEFDSYRGVRVRELNDLIQQAQTQAPKTDFFNCFLNLRETAMIAARARCSGGNSFSDGVRPNYCSSNVALFQVFQPFTSAMTVYSRAATARGAAPPFEPGSKSATPLRAEQISRFKSELSGFPCRVPNSDLVMDGDFLKDQLPGIVKDTSCDHGKLAAQFANHLLATSLSADACEADKTACEKRRRAIQSAAALISRAGLDALKPASSDCAQCGTSGEPLELRLQGVELAAEEAGKCVTAKPGDTELIHGNVNTQDPNAAYQISRLPNDPATGKPVFELKIPFTFNGEGASGEEMRKQAQSCYDSQAPYLRGPNGEFVKITAASASDLPQLPAKFVTVHSDEFSMRRNEETWNLGMACYTILHETMHAMGLNDEYKETVMGTFMDPQGALHHVDSVLFYEDGRTQTGLDFNCRAIGPNDSLMSDAQQAYFSAHPDGKAVKCICEGSSSRCRKALQEMKDGADTCPSGATRAEADVGREYLDRTKVGMTWNPDVRIIGIKVPTPKSLLSGGQFRALTEPSCPSKNKIFSICSREAYKTSPEAFGQDRCNPAAQALCKGEWWK